MSWLLAVLNVASAAVAGTATVQPPSFPEQVSQSRALAVGYPLDLLEYAYGSPPLQYQWYRDNEIVPGATTNRLYLGAAGFSDAGAYYLVAANSAGSATSKVTRVSVAPLVIYGVASFTVLVGNSFSWVPHIDSSVPLSVQWFFNDAPLPDATNAPLHFAAIAFSDAGQYYLVASNRYGMVTSVVATLEVIELAPQVTLNGTYEKMWVGEDVRLVAYVYGGPPPAIQWLFNGEPLPNANASELVLRNVTTSQRGTYAVAATNIHGSVTSNPIFLTIVAEAPFFINLPDTNTQVQGSTITLRAKAVAGPPPTYHWRKHGIDLPRETNTVLVLESVSLDDAGAYEIVARNDLGEARYALPFRVRSATGLDRWKWRLPKAQGSRLFKVASGSGRYAAVGKAANIIASENSVDWTSVTVEANTDFRTLAYGNGVFVTAGWIYTPPILTNLDRFPDSEYQRFSLREYQGVVFVSSNGVSWSAGRSPESDYFYDIAFGNGVFVSVGPYSPGFCYTSTDGLTWMSRVASGGRAYQIVFGNGRFVAYSGDGYLYHSTDGINWVQGRYGLNLLGFGNELFVGWDYLNVYTSVDGIEWQSIGFRPPIFPYGGFAGGGGTFVGISDLPAGQVVYSSDGLQWIPVDTGTRQQIEGVIYVNGNYLAVGEAGSVTRSVNGLTWTPDEVANKIDFYGIARGQGLHVVAGDAGTILTSSNGLDWLPRATPTTRNLHAVAYGDGLFAAGGRGGALMTSPDGVNWNSQTSGITNYIERIAWANGLWVAVAEGGAIIISSNGLAWSTVTNAAMRLTDHEGVVYGNGLWIVVGGYFDNHNNAVSTIFTSPDGVTWTQRAGNMGKRWRDVTFGKGKFVVVGNDGAMTLSTNGIDWSLASFISSQNLRRVQYANGRFVAVGNDGTLISSADPANGSRWTVHLPHNSQNLHDIHIAADGTFLFVGNNGMLMQSGDTRPRFLAMHRDGGLEFDQGIAENLRLEGSSDLRTWEIEALNVTSPYHATISAGKNFWRLAGD